MELKTIDGYQVVYQRQGNDRNGNPIYIVNIFQPYCPYGGITHFSNINHKTGARLDKHGNIKIISYNVGESILYLLSTIK